jgi:hypothetical protein
MQRRAEGGEAPYSKRVGVLFAGADQDAPDQPAKIAHRERVQPIRGRRQPFRVCGKDSGDGLSCASNLKDTTPRRAGDRCIAGFLSLSARVYVGLGSIKLTSCTAELGSSLDWR